MKRRWWLRALVALSLLTIAFVAAYVVAVGLLGVTCCTSYELVYVYSDEPGYDSTVIDQYYLAPWTVSVWLVAAAIEVLALAIALAALWAAWLAIRCARSKRRRWSVATRGFVWTFVVLSAALAVIAVFQHVDNWNAWHQLLASDPSIPDEPQPGQIPLGIAAFLAVPAGFAGIAFWLRARGRM